MLAHSAKEAIRMVKEISYPILVIPAPAICAEIGMIAKNNNQLHDIVDFLLNKSFCCHEPTVHLIQKGSDEYSFWQETTCILRGPFQSRILHK